MTQHAHEALGLVNKALMEDGTILNNSREAAENRVPSTVPLLCELMIENLSVTGPEGSRQIVEAFPNCVNLIHQALDVLLGLQTQGKKYSIHTDILSDANLLQIYPGRKRRKASLSSSTTSPCLTV